MIRNIRHTGVVVSNLEQSIDFYVNVLGFKIVKKAIESNSFIDKILGFKDAKVTTIKMITPQEEMIELLYFHTLKGNANGTQLVDYGLTHFAITVDNIQEVWSKLIDRGVNFISPPELSPDGYAKVAFCQDPEGVFIEIVQVLNNG
jgi:lactoylglutathione lyase